MATAKTTEAAKVKPVASTRAARAIKSSVEDSSGDSTGEVLSELRALAKELNKAAKGLNKGRSSNPKEVSVILGNVDRMTAEAATKSLIEAEIAKQTVSDTLSSLGRNWSRKDIETSLKAVSGHLTNIIVAQEFQDLAGQALRQAMKALVGAIFVAESGGVTEESRLSQIEVDDLLKSLLP